MEGIDQSSSGQQTSVKAEKAVEADIKALLAMGDLAHGEGFKKCTACHMIAVDEKKIGLISGCNRYQPSN